MQVGRKFAKAYAKQALSDLNVYGLFRLKAETVPKCHRLHFLQMAAEKSCKAHLYWNERGQTEPTYSHQVVEKVISAIMRRTSQSGSVKKQIRQYAYEIDRLAPAVDRVARPDNTEYPWIGPTGTVNTPAEYAFSRFDDLDRSFISTLKIIRQAAIDVADAK